ncbi:unnamed protein product [Bathycoccus prasinos]
MYDPGSWSKESSSFNARTKRRMGERDVWDLIVNNDDICFKHIIPRLNGTDLKFLYEVNTETRKLIKRSSREKELKGRFKVEEMSSISTLEFTWEHYPWGTYDHEVEEEMDEPHFCEQVAYTNKLELLKWIREEKKCQWDRRTINRAALKGNLKMVKYCIANECPINEWACVLAAENGQLECLKYLREEVKLPWDSWTATRAAQNGHLHILEYLVERKYDKYSELACADAAKFGHLDCLKYLHETAKAPWDKYAVRDAHKNNHSECLQYLLDNNCPLPRGVCRDVVERHVLPRLNRTDVKFLHGVNTETRKLIKRSSRAGDLKKAFNIGEMSSISTLEFAWENRSLWPSRWYDETDFCWRVAQTNKLELLKWIREEKECKWDDRTIFAAVRQGNLEIVKYCVAKKCPIDEYTCAWAAGKGNLEILKYLREEGKAPWDWKTAAWAAETGHLHILEYLVERKFDEYSEKACEVAAINGHLDCLKYLHETAKAPLNSRAVRKAHKKNQPECVQYCLDNNCPLPLGWSYAIGELHAS